MMSALAIVVVAVELMSLLATGIASGPLPASLPSPTAGGTSTLSALSTSNALRSPSVSGPSTIVVPVGSNPMGLAYDSSNGNVYVANFWSGGENVSVFNGTTGQVVGSIPIPGTWPFEIGYDSANGYLYVTDASGPASDVTVINGANNTVIGTVSAEQNPHGVVYDPSNGNVYVANLWNSNVTVINGTTNHVVTTIQGVCTPDGMAYDSANGNIYVANDGCNNVTVISGVTNQVVGTVPVGASFTDSIYLTGVAFDPTNGYLYVTNDGGANVTVINGASDRVVGSIPVGSAPGQIAYDAGTGYLYVANTNSNNVSVIDGATDAVVGSISTGVNPVGVVVDPASGIIYIGDCGSGNVLGVGPGKPHWVHFTESGLPNGKRWSAILDHTIYASSTTTAISFREPKGVYSYSMGAVSGYYSEASGSLSVAGSGVTVNVTFSPSTYKVRFTESGLAPGTVWSATFKGATHSTTKATIWFTNVRNGTYGYTIAPIAGYVTNAYSGTLTVVGRDPGTTVRTVTVSWSPVTYAVDFNETGLATGTNWSVTIDNQTEWGTGGSIAFSLPNGTYPFTIVATGYVWKSSPSSPLTVDGAALQVAVTFT